MTRFILVVDALAVAAAAGVLVGMAICLAFDISDGRRYDIIFWLALAAACWRLSSLIARAAWRA